MFPVKHAAQNPRSQPVSTDSAPDVPRETSLRVPATPPRAVSRKDVSRETFRQKTAIRGREGRFCPKCFTWNVFALGFCSGPRKPGSPEAPEPSHPTRPGRPATPPPTQPETPPSCPSRRRSPRYNPLMTSGHPSSRSVPITRQP